MFKFRPAFLAAVCASTLGAGQRMARADAEMDQSGASTADAAEHGVSEATADIAPTPPKKHDAQDSRRQPRLSGGFVAQDQLPQSPLARPSGHLHLIFPGVKDEVDVNIYNEDGSYNPDALERASHLLRCRRTEAEKPIAPQLLVLLSHVEDHFGGKPLEIVSGYRNQRKKTSNHYKGTATDIRIAGVLPRKVREFSETLDRGGMGIGLYPRSGFVHIDVRSSPSYRWIDYSPPGSNAAEKLPPRGWKRKKLQS
jgi:uncharacterized protein YcbK (DUF882 family)